MNKLFSKILKWSPFPSLILVVAFIAMAAFMYPYFLTSSYLSGLVGAYMPLILLSMGQSIVIIAGGIDVSIGALMTLVNVTIVKLIELGVNPILAFAIGLIASLIFGCINGFVVTILRVNPLLVTLATSSIAAGAALYIMPSPGGSIPIKYVLWYSESFVGIPKPVLFMVILIVIWLLIYLSPIGLQIYSVGENLKMSYVSGIRVNLVRFVSYIFASLSAGVAGIAVSGSIGSGNSSVGLSLTLMSVAACIIGGISLNGGIGNIFGAIMGSVFLCLVFNIVISANVSAYFQSLLSGGIILVSIIATAAIKRKKQYSV